MTCRTTSLRLIGEKKKERKRKKEYQHRFRTVLRMLTFDEPIEFVLSVLLPQRIALLSLVMTIVEEAVFVPLAKDVYHLRLNESIPLVLFMSFVLAGQIVSVALVNGGNPPENHVVVWWPLLQWFDNRFCLATNEISVQNETEKKPKSNRNETEIKPE